MTAWQFLIVAGLLTWIALQAWLFRVEERARHVDLVERLEERQDRAELDDDLKRMCPNVFDVTETRDELRAWQAVFIRKHEYFESRKKTLLDPHSDEPGSWGDFYSMLTGFEEADDESNFEFPPAPTDEQRGYLDECRAITEDFIAKAHAQTKLTASEINFLAYRQWKEAFFERDVWSEPDRMQPVFFKRLFKLALERYTPARPTNVDSSTTGV